MQITAVQTFVRLQYDNGQIIVQQTNMQSLKGQAVPANLQAAVTVLRNQMLTLTNVLQQHGVDGIYKRSFLTKQRMQAQQRRLAKQNKLPQDSAPPVEPGQADATGE